MTRYPAALRARRALIVVLAALAAAVALGACGKTSSSSPSSASSSSAAAGAGTSGATQTSGAGSTAATSSSGASAPASGCGSVPKVAFKDESGVIKSLGARYETAYNGYPTPIFKSAWAHYRPTHKGPYTIGMTITQPINSFQAQLAAMIPAELRKVPGVGKVTLLTVGPTALTSQIQQADQLLQQKVDILVAEPLVAQAFAGVAAKAAKAGIPFVSLINATPVPMSINIVPNTVEDAMSGAAAVARFMGGKGTVIGVHGIPSTSGDQQAFAGYKRAFALCPNITFDSSLVGEYQIPVAKQQVLSYLSSHPQPVGGAVETAEMSPGILQAFQQTGRPAPAIDIAGPSLGDLAYWSQHKSTLKAVGGTVPAGDMARAVQYTVAHLLAGHGPKVSEISSPSPVIDAANLSRWAKPGASVNDATGVLGPGNQFLPDSYLAPLFSR
jgi:ribose transport system substrate-binding protein